MKVKEFIVLAVVIILLGTYLFLRNSDRSQYELPSVSSVKTEEISRIEIASSENKVEMTRSDDQWQIGDKQYPADEIKIKNMLKELDGLKLTALVSEAKAYARYDLSDEKKISVKAWAGDRLVRNMDIGKTADTYQHTFVRLGDDPNVYHARNNFRRTFEQTTDTLRDKTALSFDSDTIKEVRISSGDNDLTLTLGEAPNETPVSEAEAQETSAAPPSPEGAPGAEESKPVWLAEDGKPAPADAIQRLLSQLAHLTCDGYLEEDRKEDLVHPIRTIILKGDQSFSLTIFEKQESETSSPATSSQNKYPFTLSDSTWTRLNESLDTLFGTEEKP